MRFVILMLLAGCAHWSGDALEAHNESCRQYLLTWTQRAQSPLTYPEQDAPYLACLADTPASLN